ncbi:hypothetical protein HK098_001591 [Nowakowskiella sp. JEL0407]|nr:hypothetical protein HK098_001591 [Nowakowskiella sp. JEL0407]
MSFVRLPSALLRSNIFRSSNSLMKMKTPFNVRAIPNCTSKFSFATQNFQTSQTSVRLLYVIGFATFTGIAWMSLSRYELQMDSSKIVPYDWKSRYLILSDEDLNLESDAEPGKIIVFKKKPVSRSGKSVDTHASKTNRIYTLEEVSQHDSPEKGVWVTYRQGVYDITSFVEVHPGGEKIMMAAGRSIEPFWLVFSIHQTPDTLELLEQYRIGDLAPRARDAGQTDEKSKLEKSLQQLFANDPTRDPKLIVLSERPFNAETPTDELKDFITTNSHFFVRNHLPVPKIDDVEKFRIVLSIPTGNSDAVKSTELSLNELKSDFKKYDIVATLQCAGNRRTHMNEIKPTNGLQWGVGAIGNAVWSGALLRDVLLKAGYTEQYSKENREVHVVFDGADGYGASIPLHKALSTHGDVLLAYEMNGQPIPLDHGSPLRVIVPGHVAARSVKWVKKISISNEESFSHWQRRDYKGFNPSKEVIRDEDYDAAKSIQEMPVQSVILDARIKAGVDTDLLEVEGYAWSAGGRGVNRVDVSGNGGKTWIEADLKNFGDQINGTAIVDSMDGRRWAWTRWSAQVPIRKEAENSSDHDLEVICKAVDSSYNVQPESIIGIYNSRGFLMNGWHRLKISDHRKKGLKKDEETRVTPPQ